MTREVELPSEEMNTGASEDADADDFRPDWYSPPGDTIKDCMKRRGVSREKLAERLAIDLRTVDGLLAGTVWLTPDLAAKLEEVFGAPAAFWTRREAQFRQDKARIDKERGNA